MKNALILHGTGDNPNKNWLPWLKLQLETQGYQVWVPQLPECDRPSIKRYNQFLLKDNQFDFNEETIIIGHSSGAVAILGLLQVLPENIKVKACYLVGAFKDNDFLKWEALDELFETPFDFELINTKTNEFVFIHADDDPYCPLDHAKFLNEKLKGELIILPGQKHFTIGSAGEKYSMFPELLEKILI